MTKERKRKALHRLTSLTRKGYDHKTAMHTSSEVCERRFNRRQAQAERSDNNAKELKDAWAQESERNVNAGEVGEHLFPFLVPAEIE